MAAVVSAAKPWTGSSLATRWPIVCMIRQPPTAVPSDSAVAETTITQVGTLNVGITPALNRARVMMPIVFWASFEPWANAMNAAEPTCKRRKRPPSASAWTFGRSSTGRPSARRRSTKPSSGEVTIGIRTLLTMPLMFSAPVPAATIVAPSRPPMSAWLLELGRPAAR